MRECVNYLNSSPLYKLKILKLAFRVSGNFKNDKMESSNLCISWEISAIQTLLNWVCHSK